MLVETVAFLYSVNHIFQCLKAAMCFNKTSITNAKSFAKGNTQKKRTVILVGIQCHALQRNIPPPSSGSKSKLNMKLLVASCLQETSVKHACCLHHPGFLPDLLFTFKVEGKHQLTLTRLPWHYFPEDRNLHGHYWMNPKSNNIT